MKKYTAEQLNDMKVEEVRKVAKDEYKLALSEKGKRFTKSQLISKIMEAQPAKKTTIDVSKPVGTPLSKVYSTLPLDKKKVEIEAYNARTLLSQAKTQQDLKRAIAQVQNSISFWSSVSKEEKKNIIQKRKIDKVVMQMNIILKSYKKKVSVQN